MDAKDIAAQEQAPRPPSQVERLTELLAKSAAKNECLLQELGDQVREHEQLTQLLQHKERRLLKAQTSSVQRGLLLRRAREATNCGLCLCAFRSWRALVVRAQLTASIAEAKHASVAVVLRQACLLLCVGLRRARRRRLQDAIKELWLSVRVKTDGSEFISMSGSTLPPSSMSIGTSPGCIIEEDQVLFATPRLADVGSTNTPPRADGPHCSTGCWQRSLGHGHAASGNLGRRPLAAKLASIAPATVPASSHEWSASGLVLRGGALAASAKLGLALERIRLDRVGFFVRRLCSNSRSVVAEADGSQEIAVQGEVEESCLRAWALEEEEEEAACRARLGEIQARAAALERKTLIMKEELGPQVEVDRSINQERALGTGLANTAQELRNELSQISVRSEVAETRSAQSIGRLHALGTASSALEERLAHASAWQEAAERRITEMASRGMELERKRGPLLQQLVRLRHVRASQDEQLQAVQCSLEHLGKEIETINRSTTIYEVGNAAAAEALRHERGSHLEEMKRQEVSVSRATQELSRLRAATVRSVGLDTGAVGLDTQACEDLRVSWDKERKHWAQMCKLLEVQAQTVQEELAAAMLARQHLVLGVGVAGQRSLDSSSDDRGAAQRMAWEAAQAEVSSEASACEQLRTELERLQARLVAASSSPPSPAVAADASAAAWTGERQPPSPDSMRGRTTPQHGSGLRELDAYAELVGRLQVELRLERAEREATEASLRSIRSAYSLLLRRLSDASAGPSAAR
mmetsp:Transcript_13079/g.32938  ORF Transcript_13079/g.32938 Transcript_13079/m.32938 type:complete len:756 (+) Transcript_13079:98-2365(+)